MEWCDKRNKEKPSHPRAILDFATKIMLMCTTDCMEGFTVYKYKTKDLKDQLHGSIFRVHPSYRTNSGQVSGVWYDWAIFNINGNDIPCQILLF